MAASSRTETADRSGMVLIVVLIVIAFLSLAAYGFSDLMLVEYEATKLNGNRLQAQSAAESGVALVETVLQQDPTLLMESGGLYSNPALFQGRPVSQSTADAELPMFTLAAPALDELGYHQGIRYGVENESARLNVNILPELESQYEGAGIALLMALPGMTEDVADAILDWIDEDDEPRELGAEIDTYATLDPPYQPKNGPLESVEELLLVYGVTPTLLFGVDANRNYMTDSYEPDPSMIAAEVDNTDGSLNLGWSAYLTIYSQESNMNSLGEPKIDLNGEDLEALHTDLLEFIDEELADFIILYRQNGPSPDDNPPASRGGPSPSIDFQTEASDEGKIGSPLDLVGATISVSTGGGGSGGGRNSRGGSTRTIESPLTEDPFTTGPILEILMLETTTTTGETVPGKLNINQCPAVLLQGLLAAVNVIAQSQLEAVAGVGGGAIADSEEMEELNFQLVSDMLSMRAPEPTGEYESQGVATWLWADGLVDLQMMKLMMPLITAGGDVYRVQAVGYLEQGGPVSRLEVILDNAGTSMRIRSWRDLSSLGKGYTPEMLGSFVTE
ncbi:General secretion pathway protein GspK [Planctomycetales bacterium 10988]|nr:General secretion pathway protein GspK [Planctomycetales bacterium 10988]